MLHFRRTFDSGSDESFVVVSRMILGNLGSIAVEFQGVPYLQQWFLVSVTVKPGWNDES